MWFSTSTPAVTLKGGFKLLGPGSVLSTNGTVVASNQSLLSKFGPSGNPIPLFNDKGLDALSVMGSSRRKTIVFSTNKGFYSKTLKKYISDGDLINNKGQIVATQRDLLSAFAPKDANKNYGLDASYIRGNDGSGGLEIWFSTNRSFYSKTLGKTIGSGDILSNTGEVIVTDDELLQEFVPRKGADGLGIDSFSAILDDKGNVSSYLFSTNKKFYSNSLKRWISGNDLLSSDGSIAMTQSQLTKNFGLVVPVCGSLVLDAAVMNRPQGEERRTPEPATLGLMTLGLLGMLRRRQR